MESRIGTHPSRIPRDFSRATLAGQRLINYVRYDVHILEPDMDAITYTAARANLASTMDRVCNDHEALIITRNGEQSVVMLSLEDYKVLEETAYLLRTPANARRLLSAIARLNAGQGIERELTE